MKFVTNQVFERMGLEHTAQIGPILDGIMRNTPEAREFVRTAEEHGVGAAVQKRDAPFGDYSQGDATVKPKIY
jgi:enoyl-CoA hydratase